MKHLNLLPKPKQKELVYEKLFYSISVAIIIAIFILMLGVVARIASGIYLDRTTKTVDVQIDQLKRTANKTENAAVKARIKEANAQINDFLVLSDKTPQWSNALAAFVADVPESVKITQFKADSTKKLVTISGFSPSRDSVIDLYNNINAHKDHFKDIDYPLENVAQPSDVHFSFTFTIVDSVIIKTNEKNK